MDRQPCGKEKKRTQSWRGHRGGFSAATCTLAVELAVQLVEKLASHLAAKKHCAPVVHMFSSKMSVHYPGKSATPAQPVAQPEAQPAAQADRWNHQIHINKPSLLYSLR